MKAPVVTVWNGQDGRQPNGAGINPERRDEFPELPAAADMFRPEGKASCYAAQTWRELLQMAACITRQLLMEVVIGAVIGSRDKVEDSTRVTLAQEGQKERIGCRTEVKLRSNH
ncbi:hypothetical protein PG985_002266 [Apiospora marii]|uniref:Uncharacterized protein n=1 Tax=Apiospora marii TaxID=335849 RepID=A0ABR1RZ34_9PEZI